MYKYRQPQRADREPMKLFRTFLSEEVETKLKHIHHVEDRPIVHGAGGFDQAEMALRTAHEHIKGGGNSSHLTMKYDGSPAVVFGHHPQTGKFFVASKSAFNVNPKLNYSHEDVLKNHGHAPGLVDKLHSALTHLPKITPKSGVYQGDMMYSEGDKEHHKDRVSFTPNTIKYTAKGEEADKIKKSKMGVIVHTQYHGPDIKSMKADPHPDVHNFAQHPDVWHKPAVHDTRNVHYSEDDQKKFEGHVETAKAINDVHGPAMYKATAPHRGVAGSLNTYLNDTVRKDEAPSTEGLKKHLQGNYTKASSKLITPAGKARREGVGIAELKHIDDNEKHYGNLLQMHHHLQAAKDVLVHTLNQHTGGLEHHIGDKKTNPEGFVVNHEGVPSKLVDRKEFSKANLLKVRK